MGRLHFYSGIVTLILFALTGQYMARILNLPEQPLDANRILYRASHIYLFWAGAANVLLGCYWSEHSSMLLRYIQKLTGAALIASQPILLYAFFYETDGDATQRPVTFFASVLVLAAVVLNVFMHWLKTTRSSRT